MLRRHLNFRQISHRFTSSFTNPSLQDLNGSHIGFPSQFRTYVIQISEWSFNFATKLIAC